jgi:hypothetical protein
MGRDDVRLNAAAGHTAATAAIAAQARQSGAAFGTAAIAARDFARLLIVLASPHLFLDSRVFHQLPKPLYRILNPLVVSQSQLNHKWPPSWQPRRNRGLKMSAARCRGDLDSFLADVRIGFATG